MNDLVHGGYVTSGSYFTYRGIRYGKGTKIRFNQQFYEIHKKCYWWGDRTEQFDSIVIENGKRIWRCLSGERYMDIVPNRDIYAIIKPYYYYEPRELVNQRFRDGTWITHIGLETLFYIICLIVSPIFQQWYLIWIIGLFVYLGVAYEKLSKP